MRTTKKRLWVLLTLLIALSAFCVSALAAGGFAYRHDPSLNPYAMKDIVADETAIYGFRPTAEGSLKMYADADWSDPEVVEKGRQDRLAYHQSIESMYDMLADMAAEGKSVEEIARAVSAKRNELRLAAYEDDPKGLEEVKKRNLEKYGHEEGPLADELYEQYGSWEIVLEKAFSTNAGMDACLGLYDDYYDVYVALGQIEEPQEAAATQTETVVQSPVTSEDGGAAQYALIAIVTSAFVLGAAILISRRRAKEQTRRS